MVGYHRTTRHRLLLFLMLNQVLSYVIFMYVLKCAHVGTIVPYDLLVVHALSAQEARARFLHLVNSSPQNLPQYGAVELFRGETDTILSAVMDVAPMAYISLRAFAEAIWPNQ